jgi:hypothetical protein
LLSQILLTESNPLDGEAEAGTTQPSFRLPPFLETKEVMCIGERLSASFSKNIFSRREEYEN